MLVRREGVPVAFFLEEAPGDRAGELDLEGLVARRAGAGVTRAAIRAELWSDPAPTPIDITVAVCTRDRPEMLGRCLDALRQLDPVGEPPSVLVIDNAPSTPATRDLVAARRDVRYVVEPTPGLDVARNRAVAEADTRHLAFVDDDVVVDRGWLRGLASTWTESPDAAAVTGLVLPAELETPAQVLFERRGGFRRGTEHRRFASGNGYRSNHPYGTGGFGTGANMAFRTEVVRSLGGFDPALDTGRPLPGGGDLDMFFRVLVAGHALVYAPAAAVWHHHRRTEAELRRQYWTWGSGYLAFLHRTFATRPERRAEVARAVAWWVRREAGTTRRSLLGRDPAPPSMAAAPLAGGLLTALWKYPWSVRRQRRRGGRT